MALRLTVLGGAAAWPNPGQGCSAYLVQRGDMAVLLDCGPNTLLELRRHTDFSLLDGVVISHCHADHFLDLVPYRYGLLYGASRPARPLPLWLPPGGIERMRMLGAAFAGQGEDPADFWDDAFDLAEYEPDRELMIGDLCLSFARTQHYIECYAIRVDSDGQGMFYSSDTGTIVPLGDLARGASVVIAEATLDSQAGTQPQEQGHLTPEEAGTLAAAAGADTLVLTHLWSERPAETVRERAASTFAGTILVARPGLHVDV